MTKTTTDSRMNSIFESIIGSLNQLKTIITKGNSSNDDIKDKPKLVSDVDSENPAYAPTFYRYIRPVNPITGEYISQQGVTLRVNLNYQKRQIKFKYAICNHVAGETSFDKKMGKMITAHRKILTIPMWKNEGPLLGCDLTEFIIKAIENKEVDIPPGDRRHLLTQYNASLTPTTHKTKKYKSIHEKDFKASRTTTVHLNDNLKSHTCCGGCK